MGAMHRYDTDTARPGCSSLDAGATQAGVAAALQKEICMLDVAQQVSSTKSRTLEAVKWTGLRCRKGGRVELTSYLGHLLDSCARRSCLDSPSAPSQDAPILTSSGVPHIRRLDKDCNLDLSGQRGVSSFRRTWRAMFVSLCSSNSRNFCCRNQNRMASVSAPGRRTIPLPPC